MFCSVDTVCYRCLEKKREDKSVRRGFVFNIEQGTISGVQKRWQHAENDKVQKTVGGPHWLPQMKKETLAFLPLDNVNSYLFLPLSVPSSVHTVPPFTTIAMRSNTLALRTVALSFLLAVASAAEPAPLSLPIRRIARRNLPQDDSRYYRNRYSAVDYVTILEGTPTSSGSAVDSVPLLNDLELYELAVNVSVGTPEQTFLLLFDTGSADTWIPSLNCQKGNGCLSGNQFDPSKSSTYHSTNYPLSITYGTGSAHGDYFVDTVKVGNMTLDKQIVAMVDSNQGPIASQNTTDEGGDEFVMDGIFGAGYPGGTIMSQSYNQTYYPFPMALWQEKKIPEPIFSVYIGESETSDWCGEIVFGGINQSKLAGDLVYTDVVLYESPSTGLPSHRRWTVWMQGFQLRNVNFKFAGQGSPFAVDTGSNFMYLPRNLAQQMAQVIDPNVQIVDDQFVVDCKYLEDKSDIKLVFPASNTAENPQGFQSVYTSIPISNIVGRREEDGKCLLFFVPSERFIIGNMILRNLVTVYDFGNHRIGFAPAALPDDTNPASV